MSARPRTVPTRRRDVARASLPWLVALASAAALFVIFAPGYYSFDSAYLWWVARGQPLDATVPVVLALLWRATAALLPDPSGFFALQLALVWGGLAFVATALRVSTRMRIGIVLAVGLWPPFLALQPHVWRDVWMVAGLLWACGALLRASGTSPMRSAWLALALLPLAFAVATRPNAITAALPLAVWWSALALRALGRAPTLPRLLPASLLATALLLVAAALPSRLAGAAPAPMWPYVALWDLAAVSIATDRMLVPAPFRGRDASPERFAEGFREDSNVPVFASGAVVYIPEAGVDAAALAELRRAWVRMLRTNPGEWSRHRMRLAGHLFGWRRDPAHAPQILAPGIVPYRDNPPLALPERPLRDALQRFFDASTRFPWFAGWPYLLALVALMVLTLRRRDAATAAIVASALANALPLAVAAPSAEFRYLAWSVVATLVAAAVAMDGQRRACRARDAARQSGCADA